MIETTKVGFLKLHHHYIHCRVRTLAKDANTKVMLQQILPLINEVKLLKVQKPKGMFWSKHPIQETLVFFYTLYGCLVWLEKRNEGKEDSFSNELK
jgi:hypothetical protein